MSEKLAFTFHHNFYPKPKVVLKDDTISDKTQVRLHTLKQDYNNIISQHNSNIRLIHFKEITIKTDPDLLPVASKLYHLPLKCHKFVKEEIENLLKAGLIKRSMGPYATPIIVVPRKCKPGEPLAETKRLIIDYLELNKQIPKVQTTQAKSKGSLALIETAKIDHIRLKLKEAKYFTILNTRSGYYHISIHPDSRPKTAFTYPYEKFQWSSNSTQCCSKPYV